MSRTYHARPRLAPMRRRSIDAIERIDPCVPVTRPGERAALATDLELVA